MKKIIFCLTIIATIIACVNVEAINYQSLSVPNIDSSFKAYEDFRCISDTSSANYQYLKKWCWIDYDGFVRANGETEYGIDNYYAVAMGSFYGVEIGTKFRITTDTGRIFYCVLCDQKDDTDTINLHRVGKDCNDILEFIVSTRLPNSDKPWELRLCNDGCVIPSYMRLYGSANTYMALNGCIKKIERIDF